MKTEEDEAFDDLAKRQGSWGGGFPAKRAMAADKFIAAEERKVGERYGYVPKLHPSEWMNDHNEDNLDMVAQPVQEVASIIQAITDPENQPSQYGTVTLDYHLAKLKKWEDRFEKLSDRALAQPPLPVQEPDALTIAYQAGFYDGKKAAQRPWVGLTEEDIHGTFGYNETRETYQFALALIAKLKEKNS
jgi:hypothetical protein